MAVLAPALIVAASAAALLAALVAQYGFDLHPCELCIWQRWPYGVAIGVGLLAIGLRRSALALPLTLLAAAAVLGSGGIGAFHVGVEQGWWDGLAGCGSTTPADDLESLRAQIMAAPVVRCTDIAFEFLGLSMAGWNVVFALGVALTAIYAMILSRRSGAQP